MEKRFLEHLNYRLHYLNDKIARIQNEINVLMQTPGRCEPETMQRFANRQVLEVKREEVIKMLRLAKASSYISEKKRLQCKWLQPRNVKKFIRKNIKHGKDYFNLKF